jgi:hypothetical protein
MLDGKCQKEQNMKPITKQLAIAAFILALVTVASLGIRQVRFSANRAKTVESPVIAEADPQYTSASEPDEQEPSEDHSQAEPDHHPAESDTVDAEPDPQHASASEPDEQEPSEDYSEAKPFKGDYAKSEGSKGLEKISLGDNENLYITGEGKLWYVSEQPDGKTAKMQVQIDDTTGEMTVVDGGGYAKSEGSKGLQRIPLGDYEDLYITGEGELWYVSEQPNGSAAKRQVQIDDSTGEITVIDSSDGGK